MFSAAARMEDPRKAPELPCGSRKLPCPLAEKKVALYLLLIPSFQCTKEPFGWPTRSNLWDVTCEWEQEGGRPYQCFFRHSPPFIFTTWPPIGRSFLLLSNRVMGTSKDCPTARERKRSIRFSTRFYFFPPKSRSWWPSQSNFRTQSSTFWYRDGSVDYIRWATAVRV